MRLTNGSKKVAEMGKEMKTQKEVEMEKETDVNIKNER
jgi:hypothetical protein